MGKTLRNDQLLDEQKRPRQEGPNRNDSNGNDMVVEHSRTAKNKADRDSERCMRKEDFPRSKLLTKIKV